MTHKGGMPLGKVLGTLVDRFWEKVHRTETCWEWKGSRSKPMGYGRITTRNGSVELAHRISWMLFRGDIPTGQYVLHHCDNPPCVNPEHLFLGTYSDNNLDMAHKGRHWQVIKTVCRNGHPFDIANTYRTNKGHRQCRKCRNASVAANYRKKMARLG